MRIANVEKYNNSSLFDIVNVTHVPEVRMHVPMISDKDKTKFIKTVERVVRGSQEYKDYIKFLKDEIDMTKCTFFSNVSNKDGKKISLEIHHEPFTLYDITTIIIDKHMSEGKTLNYINVAEEVMKVHYQDKVGLLPLSATVHELVHDGKLFIPLQSVYGNFISFLEDYDAYISQDIRDVLQCKLDMSRELVDVSILEKKYTYINVEGFNLPQVLEEKK